MTKKLRTPEQLLHDELPEATRLLGLTLKDTSEMWPHMGKASASVTIVLVQHTFFKKALITVSVEFDPKEEDEQKPDDEFEEDDNEFNE